MAGLLSSRPEAAVRLASGGMAIFVQPEAKNFNINYGLLSALQCDIHFQKTKGFARLAFGMPSPRFECEAGRRRGGTNLKHL